MGVNAPELASADPSVFSFARAGRASGSTRPKTYDAATKKLGNMITNDDYHDKLPRHVSRATFIAAYFEEKNRLRPRLNRRRRPDAITPPTPIP